MTPRFQRLIIILVSLILIIGALVLILTNYKKNIIFFYTPSELIDANVKINQEVRIGGYVKQNSIKKILTPKDLITFVITDNIKEVFVEYKGILPDMFREKQGVVAEGILVSKDKVEALKVFAKHDENYMPASIKQQIEASDFWEKDYSSNNLSNEKIPNFNTITLSDKNITLSNHDIKNKITLINFFASWCLPCKTEHPLLMELKNNFPQLMIVGFNHKDNKEDAVQFLSINGNPYSLVGIDKKGEIGIEFGVFGLPETFLVNNKGRIIYKHTGPLTVKVIQQKIVPNL